MTKRKYLFQNINLFNVILFTIIILWANHVVMPFAKINTKFILPSNKRTVPVTAVAQTERHFPSLSDYAVIAEENLFHPERKIPLGKKEEPPPLPKPDVVLYGTLVSNDVSLAYLEDLKEPRTTPGRGKRQITMRKGDILSGFALKEIETDKIVMIRGEEEIVVSIQDTHRQKKQGISTNPAQNPQDRGTRVQPKSHMESVVRDFFDKKR